MATAAGWPRWALPPPPRLVSWLLFLAIAGCVAAGSEKPSYYEVLDVPKDADAKAIKAAYRKMALKWHPDKNPGDRETAEKKFREVAEAYEVLSDPKRRQQYDLGGPDQFGGGGHGFGDFGGFGGFGGGGFHFKDPKDLFKDMFGNEDPFADFSKFFGDVKFEEQDTGKQEDADARAALEQGLVDFYLAVGQEDKADIGKVQEILQMPKWKGKEMKIFKNLEKKYSDAKYAKALETLQGFFEAHEKANAGSRGGRGGFGGFGDFGGLGDFGNLGGFKMGGDFGNMGGMDFGNMGGPGGFSSMSFSSFSSSGGGKTVKTETRIENGKRVTKHIETDASGTRATLEEEQGGKIKRHTGVKKAEQLEGSGSGGDEM